MSNFEPALCDHNNGFSHYSGVGQVATHAAQSFELNSQIRDWYYVTLILNIISILMIYSAGLAIFV